MPKAPKKRKPPATLDQLLAIADDAYGEGLVRAYADGSGEGDTLAKFLALELRDTFDPERPHASAATAVGRAIVELTRVRDALSDAGLRVRGSGRHVELVAPDGTPIRSVTESLLGNAELHGVYRNPDGTLDFEYAGETDVAWDTQEAERETETGELTFLDEGGDTWRASELVPKSTRRPRR